VVYRLPKIAQREAWECVLDTRFTDGRTPAGGDMATNEIAAVAGSVVVFMRRDPKSREQA
jgi:hypothetical protein